MKVGAVYHIYLFITILLIARASVLSTPVQFPRGAAISGSVVYRYRKRFCFATDQSESVFYIVLPAHW